jgi:hypothetical protein
MRAAFGDRSMQCNVGVHRPAHDRDAAPHNGWLDLDMSSHLGFLGMKCVEVSYAPVVHSAYCWVGHRGGSLNIRIGMALPGEQS